MNYARHGSCGLWLVMETIESFCKEDPTHLASCQRQQRSPPEVPAFAFASAFFAAASLFAVSSFARAAAASSFNCRLLRCCSCKLLASLASASDQTFHLWGLAVVPPVTFPGMGSQPALLLLKQLCQLVNSFWHHQMMGQVGRDPSCDLWKRSGTPQNIASTVKLTSCISMWFWQIMCGRIRRILPRCAGCQNVQFDEVMKDTLNPSLSDNMIGCFWVP